MTEPRRSWGPGENRSLSEAELARCQPLSAEGGRSLRAFCPFHGSDHQRSLRINTETGHFKCFACDAWGYLEWARERRRAEHAPTLPLGRTRPTPTLAPRLAPKLALKRPSELTPRPELAVRMREYRAALPDSPGEVYLAARGIPLALAERLGVGYAAPGRWAHINDAGQPIRDWRDGRIVFPHTDPQGRIVNLYGRAVGDAPKEQKHDHLPGAKGYFNAPALLDGDGPVTVCEGAFDALALMAAGLPRVIAIFGVNGWRWDWAHTVRELIFALDGDERGQAAFRALAPVARLRGKRVAYLEPEAYGGEKDASAAWVAGTLRTGDWASIFADAAGLPGDLEMRPPPSVGPEPMLWGAALLACERALDVRDKLAAYELSHAWLDAGLATLAELEDELRAEVAALPADVALPNELAGALFAWKNAVSMARRRVFPA